MRIFFKNRIAQKLRADLAEVDTFFEHASGQRRGNFEDVELDLTKLTRDECMRLQKALETSDIHGTKVLAADIRKYIRAEEDGIQTMQARTVRQAAWMLEHFVAALPHHLVFSEDMYQGGSHVAYFLSEIEFIEEHRDRDGSFVPARCKLTLVWIENDTRLSKNLSLEPGDVMGLTAREILEGQGLLVESETLVKKLEAETCRYYKIRDTVGSKYVARGVGIQDLDDASSRQSSSSFYGRGGRVKLDFFGQSTPVVVDVLNETNDEGSRRRSNAHVNLYRWHRWNLRFFSPSEDELARHIEADEDTDFAPELQIPVHPLVPCFDLKRHIRLRIHLNNLEPYVYQRAAADSLILPAMDRELIELLVDQSANTFQDVVANKGQSINILSGGPPGTGKTLTAEILAEYKERPLYTVQCSQLGLDPNSIETNLRIILQRANRWNAVLLLDEADVYISKRGRDLQQNAIVGVFLRVLEYAQCVLFMTTNLVDDVDDAIASRCIVKIAYAVPGQESQIKIWRQLARLNGIAISDAGIRDFASKHPRISGRDVKNILKLASFVAGKFGREILLADLEFALRYKPTADCSMEDKELD